MNEAPDLTPEFCLELVIKSTPHPERFLKTDDPSVKQLFDLGVVDALSSAFFVRRIQKGIEPWRIDDANVLSTRDTTVQDAADSVQNGALMEGSNG